MGGLTLPSGKIINAEWTPTKSEFFAVMTRLKPYRDFIPKKATEVLEKDWEFLKKKLPKVEKKKKEEGI